MSKSVKKLNKTDEAWQLLFDALPIMETINEQSVYKITAMDIKNIGLREPRLMTKFDNKEQRPKLFKEHKLSILPNTRGSYLIGRFEAYEKIVFEETKPIRAELPAHIYSFDTDNISSESIALNVAHASGMIDDVLNTVGDKEAVLTLTGRMSSGTWDYAIKIDKNQKEQINVVNSQIEVDGSYETVDKIAIIEAKNKLSDNFLIRQLYYPYKTFENKEIPKETIPIFFIYTDNIFSFHIYEFENQDEYSSIKKVGQKNYMLSTFIDITLGEVLKCYNEVSVKEENSKGNLFPQADIFTRVLDLLLVLKKTPMDKWGISKYYGFNDRQAKYYADAAIYLGFIEKIKKNYSISNFGLEIINKKDIKQRNLKIIKIILSNRVFYEAFSYYMKQSGEMKKSDIKIILAKYRTDIGESTVNRRATTIMRWIEWIIKNIK